MSHLFETSFPVENPVMIFSIVLFIILFAPMVFERLKVPGIIGLIVAGAVVGPNGLNLLSRDGSIILLGTAGLLFIMFLAGLEIDMNEFKKNRQKSLSFGALTFFIPMILGTLAGVYILGLFILPAVLLASMFASHTLLTYPEACKLGIVKSRIVNITVGGTIITDLAALMVLAVIAGMATGEVGTAFWIKMVVSFSVFAFIVLYVLPKVGKWFFENIAKDNSPKFVFVLSMVFVAAFMAEEAGLEPIIGAFLAGLSMNKLIPSSSKLMGRIHFVGNTLFVPIFLISVGMLIDFKVLFSGPQALVVAVTMISIATFSKWFAAFITQKIFGFSRNERNVMFGLSNAQAAATLAAVMVGYNLGLLNESILNGTILMILSTCIISSFVTHKAGKKVAFSQDARELVFNMYKPLKPQGFLSPLVLEPHLNWILVQKEKNVSSEFSIVDKIKQGICKTLKGDFTEVKNLVSAFFMGTKLYLMKIMILKNLAKDDYLQWKTEMNGRLKVLPTLHQALEKEGPFNKKFERNIFKAEKLASENDAGILGTGEIHKGHNFINYHQVVPLLNFQLSDLDPVIKNDEIYLNENMDLINLNALSGYFQQYSKDYNVVLKKEDALGKTVKRVEKLPKLLMK